MVDPVKVAAVAVSVVDTLDQLRQDADGLADWPSVEARDKWLASWLMTQFAALDDELPINLLASGEDSDREAVRALLRESAPAAQAAAREGSWPTTLL